MPEIETKQYDKVNILIIEAFGNYQLDCHIVRVFGIGRGYFCIPFA